MNQHEDIASVMEEPPGGYEPEGYDAWAEGGFIIVDTTRGSGGDTYGAGDMGMTAHRGVLHPDEYVDSDVLRLAVEENLGFTYEQIRSVYRQGPLSPDQRQLRDEIDSRLLALSRVGGNMLELAKALDWTIKSGGKGESCDTMERALVRARAAA